MRFITKKIWVVFLLCLPIGAFAAELNTIMMEATCKIQGPGSMGTGFIIGKPDTNNTGKVFYTLVTADHVLSKMQGETAVLVLRQYSDTNEWRRIELPIRIRNGVTNLWTKHPDVDVAGIFVRLPTNSVRTLLTTAELISDKQLIEYDIYPGMELMCLGYPFGVEANSLGFPILRSGRIASYPLTPTKTTKTFLFDFTVFRGNSGGPVYFIEKNPTYGGCVHLGNTIYGIAGLVVEESNITETIQELYEKKEKTTPLQLGTVIHASFIKELVDSMGYPKQDLPTKP
ncbi:serine protease [Candidatus Kuenenia sp.]|uniref:S1 family peptidase n=1 Tax=Candidatus Kuenenia sp. TaxID=2499824 RepID=UPI00321FAB50